MMVPSSARIPIPADIWIHVAQFIPNNDLCSMLNINRAFFELALNAKYYEATFNFDSDETALKRIRRLRDPFIAHRVRCLHVDLEYGNEFFTEFAEVGKNDPRWISSSLEKAIQTMTDTVSCLANILKFSVQWTELPAGEHLVSFFAEAWKSFGPGLRKFDFKVPLKYISILLPTVDPPLMLRDLDVVIYHEESHPGINDIAVLASVMAPFVNNVTPTLSSLSVHSWVVGMDVSPFFSRLRKIPNLERLTTHIDPGCLILSPSFTDFICSHAVTLRHFQSATPRMHSKSEDGRWTPEILMDWLSGNNLEEVFSNLLTLQMPVPLMPGGFTLAVQYIRYSVETLTSLGLLDHSLSFEEVKTLVSLFEACGTGRLKELSLGVTFLTPELVIFLAHMFPHLEKLRIEAIFMGAHARAAEEREPWLRTEEEERWHLQKFTEAMKTCDFHGWTLHDIDVMHFDDDLGRKLTWLFAECLPSVQTLRGKEKNLYVITTDDIL